MQRSKKDGSCSKSATKAPRLHVSFRMICVLVFRNHHQGSNSELSKSQSGRWANGRSSGRIHTEDEEGDRKQVIANAREFAQKVLATMLQDSPMLQRELVKKRGRGGTREEPGMRLVAPGFLDQNPLRFQAIKSDDIGLDPMKFTDTVIFIVLIYINYFIYTRP